VSGNPNGRPRVIDFRALVHRARGETVEAKLLAVFDSLAEQAAAGDVAAAKLLLERICGKDADEIVLTTSLPAIDMRQRMRSILEDAFRDVSPN